MAVPGGTLFERGGWQLRERRFAEAQASFSQLVKEFPGSPLAPLARSRSHLAELERAVELAGIENAQADDAAAMKLFDGLSGEPVDFAVGAADVAAATLLFKRGVTDDATTRMSRGLTRLAGLQPATTACRPLRRSTPTSSPFAPSSFDPPATWRCCASDGMPSRFQTRCRRSSCSSLMSR